MSFFTDMEKLCDYFDGAALRYADRNIERVTGEDGKVYLRLNLPQRFIVRDSYPNGCPMLDESK